MGCKGICKRYEGRIRYIDPPNKRCRKCGVSIDATKWEGVRCPCCGNVLSALPNSSKNRGKLHTARGMKRIA